MAKPEFRGECDFCQYDGHVSKYPTRRGAPSEESQKALCLVCASTFAGNAHEYPEQYPERKTMAMIAWGINYLADIAAGKVKR